jgi:hypothetical protein
MNQDKLARVYQQLGRKVPNGASVQFFHDQDCPCTSGQLPLGSCTCSPWVDVLGVRYQVSERGLLIPLRRV